MTSNEAAELISILHGAYPGTYFDGPVAETFANSFITNDYGYSKQAIHEWVNTMDRFPTIAELNRHIRRLKGDDTPAIPQESSQPVDRNAARQAFTNGYRRARVHAGDSDPEIQAKLDVHWERFMRSVPE